MAEFGDRSRGKKMKEKEGREEEKEEKIVCGRDHDHFLPIANVSRIMKKALPTNAKISKDSKDTVQECVSEFISFITGEASDKCLREKRKTVNGDDLLWAITTLGFEDYVEPLRVYLMRYREIEGDNRPMPVEVTAAREGYAPQDAGGVVGYGGMVEMERGRMGSGHVYGSDGFHGMAL